MGPRDSGLPRSRGSLEFMGLRGSFIFHKKHDEPAEQRATISTCEHDPSVVSHATLLRLSIIAMRGAGRTASASHQSSVER